LILDGDFSDIVQHAAVQISRVMLAILAIIFGTGSRVFCLVSFDDTQVANGGVAGVT
jgi:hypothetical protein